MPELSELADIDEKKTPREHIQSAIQALLYHQILYEDTRGATTAYQTVLKNRVFFDKYFDAAGRRLVIEPREGMIALLPERDAASVREGRLTKEETLVLLGLRYLLEDGFQKGRVTETGRVESTTDELYDAIRTISGADTGAGSDQKLLDIIGRFRRVGLVRMGERDAANRVSPIEVLPGVRLIVSDAFTRHVIAWAEMPAEEREAKDVFDFVQTRRDAQAGAAGAGAGDEQPVQLNEVMADVDMPDVLSGDGEE